MSLTERVTVSLPADVRQAAQQVAESTGVPFSNIVNDALTVWLRGRLLDQWLCEYEAEHGDFDEKDLQSLARETGMPYLPPTNRASAA